jgi:hypothetical protein
MSELKVDKITPRLGTTLTLGDSGDTINFGSGVLPNFENLTVTGDLTVDTNSLKVDSTNNFVGIGTATPAVALDVIGAITATGNITGTLATAAQPNITSVGTLTSATVSGDLTVDTNTLYVDSTNNLVGIGTSSPSAELHISKSADAGNAEFLIENSFATAGSTDETVQIQGRFGGYDASYIITGKEADFTTSGNRSSFMSFWTRGAGTLAEAMRIDSSGNVGIGATPSSTIRNDITSAEKALQIGNRAMLFSDGGVTTDLQNNSHLNNSNNRVAMQTDAGSLYQQYQGVHKWFNAASAAAGATQTMTERMRIDAFGNFIFNENSNDQDFRVESSTNNNALFVQGSDGHVGVGTGTLPRTLNIYGASNGTIGLDNPVSGSPQIAFKQNETDKAFVTYWDAFDTLALSDGSGNGLHFKPSTGNVGIGTSSPSAKLEVNGDVLIPEATLTDGATISWDVSTSPVAKVTLGGNRTLSAPSNSAGAGQFISLLVIQDGTGSRTLTWNAVYEFASDIAPVLTTTGGKGDLFVFRYNGTKWLEVGRNLNLSLS